MEKSTKLIIVAIGLGGLGYFLYKKGLFAKKTTTEIAKDVKKIEDKNTIVESVGDTIAPKSKVFEEPANIPIWAQTEIYKADVEYPQEGKLVKQIVTQDSFNPYLYDRLPVEERTFRVDYSTGRYNPAETFDYAERDLDNIRFNKLLYV